MGSPALAAQEFVAEWGPKLDDGSLETSNFTLLRVIRRCDEFIGAGGPSAGLSQLFSLRGTAWKRLGDVQRAVTDFHNAVQLRPDDASNHINYAAALINLNGEDNLRAALSALTRATQMTQAPALRFIASRNLCALFTELGDCRAADRSLRDCLGWMDTTNASQLFAAARGCLERGWGVDAIELLARHLALRAGEPRGDAPATEVIGRLAPDWSARSSFDGFHEVLAIAFEEWNGQKASPEQESEVRLSPAAWERLEREMARPAAPTPALVSLLRGGAG